VPNYGDETVIPGKQLRRIVQEKRRLYEKSFLRKFRDSILLEHHQWVYEILEINLPQKLKIHHRSFTTEFQYWQNVQKSFDA